MESDRIKWNQRFESEESYLGQKASPFLAREIDAIMGMAPGKRAVDIACGEGRNSVFLARHGFTVTALDISDVGLEKGKRRAEREGVAIDFLRVDLDEYRFTDTYDLIINFNFLLRDLIPRSVAALAAGGLLVVDTIMESPQLLAAHRNPDFFLGRGELRQICENLPGEILIYEELPDDEMPTARVLFRKDRTPGVTGL